jgi:hypothetical protein
VASYRVRGENYFVRGQQGIRLSPNAAAANVKEQAKRQNDQE